MKSIYKIILPVMSAAVISFASCSKDYLNINDDPNRVTDNNITPELIFPQAANGVGVRQASANLRFINNWMGYFSPPGDFAIEIDETTYNVDFSFGDALWQNEYNVLFDLEATRQKAIAKGDNVLAGAAMILSARLFQDLVDIYGNIPFSEAFQNEKTRTPKYDKGVDVYAALQTKLDTAIAYMEETAA